MHNCNATNTDLVELALSRTPGDQSVLAGIRQCPACREEFAALQNALRATDLAMQAVQPAEIFWPGYRERFRERLQQSVQTSREGSRSQRADRAWWLKLVTASIRVPVPVAAALVVLMMSAIVILLRAPQSASIGVMPPPSVVTRTIPVPVIQEKIVTRVVYKSGGRLTRDGMSAPTESATALQRRGEPASVAQGLEGFKPANEPRLTIINGRYQDEK